MFVKSLFFKISFLFLMMFALINYLFYEIYLAKNNQILHDKTFRYQKALSYYQEYKLYKIDYNQFITNMNSLKIRYIPKPTKNDKVYFQDSFTPFSFKDLKKYENSIIYYILLDIIFMFFYIFIIYSLLPLKKVTKFVSKIPTNKKLDIKASTEIEEIVKALNNASQKIISLNESRKLFLRNIFHELLTPITKIKLTIILLNDEKQKMRIENSVNRLEEVIKSLKELELITSQTIKLHKQTYSIENIIKKTFEISLSRIEVKFFDEYELKVDIYYFSIAFKNLIDNAVKYGKNPKIEVYKDKIVVSNEGIKLQKPFENYIQPFSHEYENSYKGLGLGLYIANEIIKLHNFKLIYEYNQKNIFIIWYNSKIE